MTLGVAFRRAARAEFIDATERYESQRPNLGVEFIAEIERCLALAAERPELHASLDRGIRRIVARRFPYSIYFRAEARRIVVLAVFHARRNPAIWQTRD